jgi:hypothetical protein
VSEGVPLLCIKKIPTLRFEPIVHGDRLGNGRAGGWSGDIMFGKPIPNDGIELPTNT